jgi:hypothetical protein
MFEMRKLRAFAIFTFLTLPAALGQQASPTPNSTSSAPANASDDTGGKRILWIIPNFRTSPMLYPYSPLSPCEKFKIATQDALDRGTIGLALAFAGESQLSNANPSFGQGVKGYAHYFGTAYADFFIGDYMTEAVFPTILHQDPRYFRKGKGSGMSRLGYACGQIFVTHNDSGKTAPNYSEVLGNAAAVAISMSYYPDNRDAKDAGSKLGTQLAVDMVSNVLKEFWPDISRKFSKKHSDGN